MYWIVFAQLLADPHTRRRGFIDVFNELLIRINYLIFYKAGSGHNFFPVKGNEAYVTNI